MRTIFLVTMAGMVLVFAMLKVKADGPHVSLVSSSSEIYIHGTPVCVTQAMKQLILLDREWIPRKEGTSLPG